MVKVAENRVVNLDLFPGDPKGEKLAEQTKAAIAGKIPPEDAQGLSSNAQSAVSALGGTVGGGVKGVVDTLGNTVGSLGEGVVGTVQGVGDGVGSTVQFAGGALGAGAGKAAGMVSSGDKQGQDEAIEAHKERLQEAGQDSKEIPGDVEETVQEHSKDAYAQSKETAAAEKDADDETSTSADGHEKAAGVASSSS